MKKTILIFLLVPLLWTIQACQDEKHAKNYNDETNVDVDGLNFMQAAAEAGNTEIKASTVAESISKNPRIISFAKMMVADHSANRDKIGKLENKKLVDTGAQINVRHARLIDSLSKLSAGNFDKAYMGMMVSNHQEAVNLYKQAGRNRIVAVKSFADKTLPILLMHLDSAKAIFASLK